MRETGGLCWFASHFSSRQALLASRAVATWSSFKSPNTCLARSPTSLMPTPCSTSKLLKRSVTESPRPANLGLKHMSSSPSWKSWRKCATCVSTCSWDEGRSTPKSKCRTNNNANAPQCRTESKASWRLCHSPTEPPRCKPTILAKKSNTGWHVTGTPQEKSLTPISSIRQTNGYQCCSITTAVMMVATGSSPLTNASHVLVLQAVTSPVINNGSQTWTPCSPSASLANLWRHAKISSSLHMGPCRLRMACLSTVVMQSRRSCSSWCTVEMA